MSGGNGHPQPYRVTAPGPVRDKIRKLGEQAASMGLQHAFVRALRALYARLRSDPLSVGELVGKLPAPLNLLTHVGSEPPITIRFSVQPEQRVVFIRDIWLHPHSL
jgi:hypothetical protein